jgi:hypothetical protein
MVRPAPGGSFVESFRAAVTKAVLIVLGLGSIARADSLQTIIEEGKVCPLLFDWANGGTWRHLTPTVNDVVICPDFTYITTGLA